jgi:hypothetical protein
MREVVEGIEGGSRGHVACVSKNRNTSGVLIREPEWKIPL